MKLDNLEVGMVVKNYKELCRLLELTPTTGQARQNQISWIEDYVKYEKQGHKFIIKNVYSDLEILPMKGRGGCTYVADYPQFEVHPDKWDSIGIYKITRNDDIYIGSTAVGFRKRFLGHTTKANTLSTFELIHNGGTFKIIQECNNMVEDEIRALERKYIRYYNTMPEKYFVLNEQGFNEYKTKNNESYKYKIVKKFDAATNNMITQYKQGNKLLHEKREKIDSDPDVAKMMELIEEESNEVR